MATAHRITDKNPNRQLTTAEAAEELGITPGRVRQLVIEGRIPTQKIGRDLLIRLRDLDAVRDRKPGRPVGYRAGAAAEDPAELLAAATGIARPDAESGWLVPAADTRSRRR